MEKPISLTDLTFESEVVNAGVPVLVDFWAPWCGPCRAVAPVMEELVGDLEGRAKVAKINVDENQQIAGSLGIMSIPTVMVFNGKDVVEARVGVQSKSDYIQMVEKALESSNPPVNA